MRNVMVFILGIAVMLLGLASTPGSALAADDYIDFETLPDGTPTTDGLEITNQYSNPPPPATYTGVTFSLDSPDPAKLPKIAKVGTPLTAFTGPVSTKDPNCWDFYTRDDMPRTQDQDLVECSFLTRDEPVGKPPNLIVDYDSPVTEAGGYILDIDGPEGWEITAYLNLVQVGLLVLDADDANNEDGVATLWVMSVPGGFDRLVFQYVEDPPEPDRNVGLAFDRFYTSSLPPEDIPTLTEWGMIIFGVLLIGFITYVFLRRRKAVVSLQ